MIRRKRTILSAAQKHEICETKEREPSLPNVSLAQRYGNNNDVKDDKNIYIYINHVLVILLVKIYITNCSVYSMGII